MVGAAHNGRVGEQARGGDRGAPSRVTWWLLGPGLTALVLWGSVYDLLVGPIYGHMVRRLPDLLAAMLALVAVGSLLGRRQRPFIALGVSAAAVAAMAVLGYPVSFVACTVFVNLASVTYRCRLRTIVAGVIITVATAALAALEQHSLGEDQGLYVALLGTALALGTASRYVESVRTRPAQPLRTAGATPSLAPEPALAAGRWWHVRPGPPPAWPSSAGGRVLLAVVAAVTVIAVNVAVWQTVVQNPEIRFADTVCRDLDTWRTVMEELPPRPAGAGPVSAIGARRADRDFAASKARATSILAEQLADQAHQQPPGSEAEQLATTLARNATAIATQAGDVTSRFDNLPTDSTEAYTTARSPAFLSLLELRYRADPYRLFPPLRGGGPMADAFRITPSCASVAP